MAFVEHLVLTGARVLKRADRVAEIKLTHHTSD
jgi:hypothetical protein